MKAIIFLSVLCFQLMILKAQQTQYFNKTELFTPVLNTIQSVIEADSHYVVLFGIVDSMNIQKAGLAKIDKQGNLIKQEIWGAQDTLLYIFPGNSLVRTQDSGYMICGQLVNSYGETEGFITKFDNQLSMQFTRHYHHPDSCTKAQPGAFVYNTFTAIRQTWDGGFIISGNYQKNCDPSTNYRRSYLLKTNSLGEMEWIKKYNNIGRLFDVRISHDSGYIFSNLATGFNLTKTNHLGEIQWTVKPNNDAHLSAAAFALSKDSSVILASPHAYHMIQGTPLFGIDICKIRLSDKSITWNRKYNLFTSFESHSLNTYFSIVVLENDEIVINGTSMVHDPKISGTAEYKGVMMKLSQEGDSLWARYYYYGKFKDVCQFNHFVTTDDGGFLAVGYYQPIPPGNASWSAWLVKMDSLGCDTPGCHLIGIEELSVRQHGDMILYPNPFSHELNIVLPNGPAGATATLYDMQGRMMHQTRIPEFLHTEHYTLQTHDLPPGIYILQLVTKEGATHVGRVVRGR